MSLLARRIFAGYRNREKLPLASYAVLDLIYSIWVVSSITRMRNRGKQLPETPGWQDLALIGVATHKLSLILTKEYSTAPLRAAFTEFKGIEGSGELNEVSRGEGLQEAIGDLMTCPYCSGVWIATGFYMCLLNSPRVTRLFASIMSSVAISDFLHSFYERVTETPEESRERAA